MPSLATLFTPLALLLLATAAPAGSDLRRSRSGKRACSRSDSNQLIAQPADVVSSVNGIGSSVIAEVSSAVGAIPSISLAPVNEGFGLSVCVGAGMDCNQNTATATAPTTAPTTAIPTTTQPLSSAVASSAEPSASSSPNEGNASDDKMVFAHFMIGIVATYQQQDYVNDMTLAKSKGIDGFALNIGLDSYTQPQLLLAYAAAEQVGFLCFISFDFNWYSTGDTAGVANVLKQFTDLPAAYKVDGKPFVSSFIGDGFDWGACATLVGQPLYAVPFFQPTASLATDAGLSGSFSWDAWPGQLNNVPVDQNLTTERDDLYLSILQPAGKTYMAPVSPWFFTHYGHDVSYAKNWLFYSEELWKYRWNQILELGMKGVNLVEIVTWNDYGESHNVGPFNTPHTNDGAALWASGLDHTAMLDLSVPYIQAFKAGIPEPVVTQEFAVYWHRPTLKDVSCDSTDNCGSKPTGWEFVSDSVFVATVTKHGADVTVTSGNNAPFKQRVAGGIQVFQVPMAAGEQSFTVQTTSGATMQGSSNVTVLDTCWNGIYNFNFHSGTLLS